MKNKILVLFLLCLTIIPIFNNLYAYSFTHIGNLSDVFGDGEVYNIDDEILENKVDKTLTLDEWHLNDKALKLAEENGYISLRYPYSYTDTKLYAYILFIPKDKDCKFYKDGQDLWHTGSVYYFCTNVYDWTVQSYVSLRSPTFKFDKACILTDYINTIPIYTDNTFSEIFAGCSVNQDDTIGDLTSDLQLSYEYNEDNTSCHINATLKNGAFTDQIYYSNWLSAETNKLIDKQSFPKTGIDVTENQILFFQAEDTEGNILAKNSIKVYNIGKLDPEKFEVTFNFSKGMGVSSYVNVFPKLDDEYLDLYEIYYKIELDNVLTLYSRTNHFNSLAPGVFNKVENNEKMNFSSSSGTTFSIYFELRNVNNGNVDLTKKYEVNLKAGYVNDQGIIIGNNNSTSSGILGGVINEGKDDEAIMTPENDKNFEYNYNTNYEKMSLEELMEMAKDSFTTFKTAFSILPWYIWSTILILLGVAIALRILGR